MNRMIVVGCAIALQVALGAGVAFAASEYPNVGYGDTVEISENRTNAAVSVAGRLIVSGGVSAQAANTTVTFGSPADDAEGVKTPAVIEVRAGEFGQANKNLKWTTMNLGDAGGRGQLIVKGGTLGVAELYISANTATNASGYIDFLRMEGGTARLRSIANKSSHASRVVVAGTSTLTPAGMWYPTMHSQGQFVYEIEEGAALTVNSWGVYATFNSPNVSVLMRGQGDVKLATTGAGDEFVFDAGARFDNSGRLTLTGTGASSFFFKASGIVGSNVRTLEVKAKQKLALTANTTQTVHSVVCSGGGYISGQATLIGVADTEDIAWYADLRNGVEIVKEGAYDMTLAGSTNYTSIVVSEGRLIVTNDCLIESVTIASGASLVIDGASVRITERAGEGTVETRNGGVQSIYKTAGEFRHVRIGAADRFVKDGPGDVRLYDPALTGLVHVAGGRLAFSHTGLTDRYLKFTFKEMLQFVNGVPKGIKSMCVRIRFYDPDDVFSATAGGISEKTMDLGKDPSTLKKGEMTAPVGTTYDVSGEYNRLFRMFRSIANYNDVIWTTCLITNKLDSGCWQTIWYRLPDDVAAELDGINVYGAWEHAVPKTWTVETSATGADGTWRTVLDKDEQAPGLDRFNCGWMSGDETKPAYHFSYENPGVLGLADALAVEVDADATLDFAMKEERQGIDRIVYDTARGGGTLKNIRLAESGTLEIASENKVRKNVELPWTFVDSDLSNARNWTVLVNGEDTGCSLLARDGKLTLVGPGLCVIFK